jgi:fido (protein-threonine AMPylation protein)
MQTLVTGCPDWEYTNRPGHGSLLTSRSKLALQAIRNQQSTADRIRRLKNTRPRHRDIFRELTPDGHDYYAGNYRGDPQFICLLDYEVKIPANPLVGIKATEVPLSMRMFAEAIDKFIEECDLLWPINEQFFSAGNKIVRAVELGVSLFSYFLIIHPYANGNGHIARLLLIAALAKYGIFLSRWPLHPRPQDPPYSDLITQYQTGADRASLVKFVISCI